MKKTLMILAAAAAMTTSAANKGSCEAAAVGISVGKSGSVKLTAEYDPDWKEYDPDSGVYYLSVTLSRGASYTLTYSSTADVMVYPRETTEAEFDNDIYEPMAQFEDAGEYNGVGVQYMYSDSWDYEDPSAWKYYIVVSGDVGDTVSIGITSGIVAFATPGTEENPTQLAMADGISSKTYSFVDEAYYFKASLKSGRLYRIRTTGGTAAAPVTLNVDATVDFEQVDDPKYASDTNNAAVIIAPAESGDFTFTASGEGSAFNLVWQSIPTRAITAHPSSQLSASNGYSTNFVPGRLISSYDYADEIIDEHLCSIALAKDECCVFETEGAAVESEMILYDSKGKVLASNMTKGNGSYDLRLGYKAPAAGTYYVGVCEPILGVGDEPTGDEIVLTATKVAATDGEPDEWDATDDTPTGATPLSPLPGTADSDPITDGAAHGPHRLGMTDWADCFQIGVRKGITYVLTAAQTGGETTDLKLKAEVFTLSGTKETKVNGVTGGIDPTDDEVLTFTPTANATYYIRVSVAEGQGLDYPDYTLYAMAYTDAEGEQLGTLTVNTPGAPTATWSLDKESTKYPGGTSLLLSGTHAVKFSSVNGYKASVSTTNVTVVAGAEPTVVEVKYIDTFDPKDDAPAGKTGSVTHAPTALTFKNVETDYAQRTLWDDDPEDNFAITGADGYYYDIALKNVEGDDVVFSITNAELGVMAEDVKNVKQLTMPKTKSKYYLAVKNGAGATTFGGYTLAGKFANVGAIKFASNKASAKENAGSVKLTVNRTAKDGYVRVKYGTVADTAKPGVDYVAQSGVLEWENGDSKAKTIEVKLLPDLVPVYEGNKTFSVQLKALEEDEIGAEEYPATFSVGFDECVVTLTETAKATDTVESAYAKKAPKLATVKTEQVGLESGTFYGVIAEDGSALTNGFPSLASVTLTAPDATAAKPKFAAKVALGGKTYSFAASTGWEEGDEAGTVTKEFQLAQKLNKIDEETGKSVSVTMTNILTVTVATGATGTEGDWLKAVGTAELVMNVPDSNNKGYQEEIVYRGSIYRNNAKIQDYLTAVTNFTGYYTVALAPEAVSASDGIPAGNGYLTLTVDNKGTVKAAGMLADGTTKPSLSVAACALVQDDSSANGYSMRVPLYFAKSPAVFGGEIRLYADESGVVVVDSSEPLVWKNDNAKLTYLGEEGYSIDLDPVGGFYDTVINLQAYYLNYLFEVGTVDISEFPAETAESGFRIVTDVQPNGAEVNLAGDVFSTAKKSLVKNGKLTDLVASVNPCNVQVKLARATGLVTGSFSTWSEKEDGSAQKEIAGIKHNGVLLLSRDAASTLPDEVVSVGFFTKAVNVTDVNETTGKTSKRSWTCSLPFNLISIDQGEIDWWAEDWGENSDD